MPTVINYELNMLTVQATVAVMINYNRKMLIVQATGLCVENV